MKIVKVARVGRKVVEVALDTHATVGMALAGARLNVEPGELVYVDHVVRSQTWIPMDGQSIVLERPKIVPRSDRLKERLADFIEEDLGIDIDLMNEDDVDSLETIIRIVREG